MCELQFSWEVSGCNSIDDVVVYRSDLTSDNSPVLQNHNGINLYPSSTELGTLPSDQGTHPCELTIAVKPSENLAIDAVDVLCSARHIEIFSSAGGEYIETVVGTRIDAEINCGRCLYMIQCSWPVAVTSCMLRFVSLETTSELWIHSIHITMTHAREKLASSLLFGGPKIDLEKVASIVSEIGEGRMASEAKDLMTVMAEQQKVREKSQMTELSQPPSFAALLNIFGNIALGSASAAPQTFPTSMASDLDPARALPPQSPVPVTALNTAASSSQAEDKLLCGPVRKEAEKVPAETGALMMSGPAQEGRCPSCGHPLLDCLEQWISRMISDAELRITAQMSQELHGVESRLNERLDRILAAVSNS